MKRDPNSTVAPYFGWVVIGALAAGPAIDRADYQDRLRAMWLGKAIANWTGLRTEIQFNNPPFPTDASWGGSTARGKIEFVLDQDPWLADDDTDIEYVLLHLINQHGTPFLTAQQLRGGWISHINREIWVSNQRARNLMNRGIAPPATGMGVANSDYLMIDAQLVTEVLGALAPGMPEQALRISDLPIRTSSAGYATHAAQFHVLLYSHAPMVDRGMSGREKVLALVDHARAFIPDSSKTADIVDFVRADYLANPDREDWERTRDRIYIRYHRDAAGNGFRYRGEFESSVNFATGIMALLYGEGDYPRTIRIGALSGWDSDNPTATMGGVVALTLGYEGLRAQFGGRGFSDRFDIYRTRDSLPDYLPGDAAAQDTFTLMAARMMPMVDQVIVAAGGRIDSGTLVLPPPRGGNPLFLNPTYRDYLRSANNRVVAAGGTVSAFSSSGLATASLVADGAELDFSGREDDDSRHRAFSTQAAPIKGDIEWIAVSYDRPIAVHTVRFIEGDHTSTGGWFDPVLAVRLLIDGEWRQTEGTLAISEQQDAGQPFQTIDFVLAAPVSALGVWIEGRPGGSGRFVTCAELDALAPP